MTTIMKINKLLIIMLTLALIGCTRIILMPNSDNSFTAIATAANKATAYNTVANKAASICKHANAVNVLEREIVNQDKDSEQLELLSMAKTILPANKTAAASKIPANAYRAKLVFTCDGNARSD